MVNLIQGQVFSFEGQLYAYIGKFENAKGDDETWLEYFNSQIKDKFFRDDFYSLGIGDPFDIGKNDILYFYNINSNDNSRAVIYVLDEYGHGVFVRKESESLST